MTHIALPQMDVHRNASDIMEETRIEDLKMALTN